VSTALAVATRKREGSAPAVQHEAAPDTDAESAPPEVGVPRWLQHRAAGAAGDDSRPRLQHKCAACAAGGAPCPACAEEEQERLQKKEQPGNGAHQAQAPARIHALAHHGVQSAHAPLPHFARIQAAFGRHDLHDVKAQVGGPASAANARMGSLGYTVGDRVGFRAAPDLRLAAHEAAHVVQQRGGVQLKDGVGRPGDPYEQQADAVADAVESGERAEPLLDHPPAGGIDPAALARKSVGPEPGPASLQHQLAINATRLFDPPAPAAPAARGPGGGGAKPSATPSEGGESKSKEVSPEASEDQTDATAKADAGVAPEADASASPAAGGAPQSSGAEQPACKGTGDMHCYQEPAEDPPEGSDQEEPPEPQGTKSKEEMSGDTEELPELDDCPAEKALAAQAPAAGAAPGAATQPGAPAAAPAEGTQAAPAEAAPPAGGEPAAGGEAAAGAAPGGGEAEAAEPAGAGFDAGISQAEAQRDAAAAAYMDSSTALSGAANAVRTLHTDTTFTPTDPSSAEASRSSEAGTRVDRFFSAAADRLDAAIAFATQQLPDRLGAQAESGKATLAATIETQKSAISSRIEQARGQAIADAATARDEVLLQADAFVQEAEVEAAAAIETLRASHTTAMEQVNELETTTLDRVNQIYADGRAAQEALGVTVGDECIGRGEEFAVFYLTPQPAGCWTDKKDSFFKGYLTQRRAEAQANAARETATGYRKSLIDSAKKRAREVVKTGRKADRCAVIAAASQARDTLDQQLKSITTVLGVVHDSTIQQASNTRDSLIDTVDSNLAATLQQLDQQEHDQRQAADDTGYLQQVLQEQTAHASAAALQRNVVDAVKAAQSGLAMVRARFAGSATPDLALLEEALALVARNIDGAVGNLETGLESGVATAAVQLAGAAQQGVASLEAVSQSSDDLAAATQDGFCTAMSTIAGTDNFAALRSGFTQQVEQTAAGGSDALANAVGGMRQACDAVTSGAEKSLAQSAVDLEKSLRDSKQGLECEIPKRADAAAAREAPAWKRVIAVVLIILVIIIMIVVTVVTFGSGGILAGIVVGAIVGAITSAMIQVATNLLNNRSAFAGVFRAFVTGLIMGAIGGGLGAWMGGALKAAQVTSKLALFAANIGLAAGLNIGFQFYSHGFSFENFSFGQLGFTLLVAAVTFGIGAKFGGRVQIGGGPKAGQPPAGGPPPSEPAAPAPGQPAPAGPPRLTLIKGGGGVAQPAPQPTQVPVGGGGVRGNLALATEPLPIVPAPAPRPALSLVPEPVPVPVPEPVPVPTQVPEPPTAPFIVPTSTAVGIAAAVVSATQPGPGSKPVPTPTPVPVPVPQPGPQPKPKPPTDSCHALWRLAPGSSNARLSAQRAAIGGDITVDWAAFRLDKGFNAPAGQGTTPASRAWVRRIGLPKDDAGHVIARRFGGTAAFNSSPDGNIFPQDLSFNRAEMRMMDAVAADLHKSGCDVCAKITLSYASPTDLRPEAANYQLMYRSVGATGFNPIIGANIPNP
jgi:hypothetical protein